MFKFQSAPFASKRSRRLLLAGASLITLLAAHPAAAQTLSAMRGTSGQASAAAPGAGSSGGAPVTTIPTLAQSARIQQTALQDRAARTLVLARQAQLAARGNPPRTTLDGPTLNGLGPGALQPATDRPVDAASDPTGLLTWQGADMPTQAPNAQGGYDVDIKQNQSKALLSWTTFNVGQETNLNFDQQGHHDWIVMNRVVGQTAAPSKILGAIKADGTVLVINQNGIIFGGRSQINTHALIASTLEVGHPPSGTLDSAAMAARNAEFLSQGLLGFSDAQTNSLGVPTTTFSSTDGTNGAVTVEEGAAITADGIDGLILLTGPQVTNSGHLVANDGQVLLQAGSQVTLLRSTGDSGGLAPAVRGLIATSGGATNLAGYYVRNTAEGLIEAARGNITLGASSNGAVLADGILTTTTSVARNGSIRLSAGDVQIGAGASLLIGADTGPDVVPHDAATIAAFKPSDIFIGNGNDILQKLTGDYAEEAARVSIGAGSLILAPGAQVQIGAAAGSSGSVSMSNGAQQIFIDTGAVIDVSGLTDVQVPASRNQITIDPVTNNELADASNYQNSFLKGVKVYVDPRLSGVRDDGVAWIGSPLINAASYYAQVGVTASELLTKGGNVSLGVNNYDPSQNIGSAGAVIVKPGAKINISGGWVQYQAGQVQSSRLVTADGRVVDISDANPNDVFVGFAGGFSVNHSRWGVVDTYMNVFNSGQHNAPAYMEGHDAGTLTLIGSALAFDGVVTGQAYAGQLQIASGGVGTGKSKVYGDQRAIQGAATELPSGGAVLIQAARNSYIKNTDVLGGADILLTDADGETPLDQSLLYGFGLTIDADGKLVRPATQPVGGLLPAGRRDTISLDADMLSAAGLSQLTLITTGAITVDKSANLTLAPGGVFNATAGRTLTVDGDITAAGGAIYLETSAAASRQPGNIRGSVFKPTLVDGTSYDVVVNGNLSVRGRWVNDFGKTADQALGGAYLNGGTIVLSSAADVLSTTGQVQDVNSTSSAAAGVVPVDYSGSVLVNRGATLDLTGGGRVDAKGKIDLSAKGGNLVLDNQTAYFQLAGTASDDGGPVAGTLPGLRAGGMTYSNGGPVQLVVSNPAAVTSTVTIDGTILAHGFGGGGNFALTTPVFALGDARLDVGTELPLDFFSKTGFGSYAITSYKTSLTPSHFAGTNGGYDALLAVQTVTIGKGQTLDLTQSVLPSVLDGATKGRLLGLATGDDVLSIVAPATPANAWDQKAVNLTLGGALELHVAEGGQVIGAAGANLTVGGLVNEGYIRLAGGTITQQKGLPGYLDDGLQHGFADLSEIFDVNSAGKIDESQLNKLGLTLGDLRISNAGPATTVATNRQLAQYFGVYLTGMLAWDEGVRLAPGSVTDLSGTVIVNPYANVGGQPINTGRIVGGGTLQVKPLASTTPAFPVLANTSYAAVVKAARPINTLPGPDRVVLQDGSKLDLSGAWGVLDLPVATDDGFNRSLGYQPGLVWSDGGALVTPFGLSIADGARIDAHGGSIPVGDPASALGQTQSADGTLQVADLVLTQGGGQGGPTGALSADKIMDSGFGTLVSFGSVQASGDVDLTLNRGFFLVASPYFLNAQRDAPKVLSSGGSLTINAPYIQFNGSGAATVANAAVGAPGAGTVTFNASQIDVLGSLLVDRSVATANFNARDDIRLIGVDNSTKVNVSTLTSQIAASGDLNFTSAQLYATTGSIATISSAGADSTITFARSGATLPDAPYSAGSSLSVLAAHIVQGGVLRAPLGTLTLGSTAAATGLAPATQDVVLTAGSVTSVSANGLSIPYGTTTDQKEWFFAPGGADPLNAPPSGLLTLSGAKVVAADGSQIDLSGGGDVYAYEFVPGVGGSHDELDRLNPDVFTGDKGLQYADGRQVYAIVPGLSDATAAAYDPVYSADYAALSSVGGVGSRVWLDGGGGLAAGWYTLLPAKYAMLPGAYRVVQQTGAKVTPGARLARPDGSILMTGHMGDAASGAASSTVGLFEVQSRATVLSQSNIQLTSGNAYFAANAKADGLASPRLALDAGRLVLAATSGLTLDGRFDTAAAPGGRGAQVDLTASRIEISSTPSQAVNDGVVHVTAAELNDLNAGSLLIGGMRTDRADGTTSLEVTAQNIVVDNDAVHPLIAPEIVLAVGSQTAAPGATAITLADGATITATGVLSDTRNGAYVIDGTAASHSTMTGDGVVLRVANGPERLVTRLTDTAQTSAVLTVGAAQLSGQAVMLDSTGRFTLDQDAALTTKFLTLGAGQTSFASSDQGLSGLVITPELRARLAGLQQLTVRTRGAIGFDDGTYDLGGIRLDAAGIKTLQGGRVVLTGDTVVLSNQTGASLAAQSGSGALSIQASQMIVGPGTMSALGYDSVVLSASSGVYGRGTGGLDLGDADVAVHTPFMGDRVDADAVGAVKLSLTTRGQLSIDNQGAAANFAAPAAATGGSLNLTGGQITIAGATLRETAGAITLTSDTGVVVRDGATIATPGYDKSFGDTVDPVSAAAPAGHLTVTARGGDVVLGAGATFSVGGGHGAAGSLVLSAADGVVTINGNLDGKGATGGGNLALVTRGAFDLAAAGAAANAAGFTGALDFSTRQGDLVLGAGQTLKAGSINLTADGGLVRIAGTLDTSGVNGGDVSLYGHDGVTLTSSAVINATASGYAADDSRQARGGTVTLGTEDQGVITLAGGALIDVSALRPGDRLVQLIRGPVIDHQYVQGDLGGAVILRAPVIDTGAGDTVNISVASAGSVKGASTVTVEGFKRWDLGQIAASGHYSGVTYDPATDTITLDVGADLDTANNDGTTTAVGGVNFLGDAGAGTVVDFVRNFDISRSYGNLGGLASQANFHAAPGVDLAYGGNVVLASNWNLGAGVVNVNAAVAGGAMADNGAGQFYVVQGREAQVISDYTRMLYRVGGAVTGEAPIVDLRAGGDLRLNGSISDGFFEFGDPNVVSSAALPSFAFQKLGGVNSVGLPWFDYSLVGLFLAPYYLDDSTGGGSSQVLYSQESNSAAATSATDMVKDAVIFPVPMQTSSYRMVAGADLASANPTAIDRTRTGTITIKAYRTATTGGGGYAGVNLLYDVGDNDNIQNGSSFPDGNSHLVPIDQLAQYLGESNEIYFNTYDGENYPHVRAAIQAFRAVQLGNTDPALAALVSTYGNVSFDGSLLDGPAAVVQYVVKTYFERAIIQDLPLYFVDAGMESPFGASGGGGGVKAIHTVIRTGTGAIAMASAGDANFYDAATDDVRQGGAAVYTTGVQAHFNGATLPDPITGRSVTLAAATLQATAAGASYLTGGGSISLAAGGDIRSARTPSATDYLVGLVGNDLNITVRPGGLVTTDNLNYGFLDGVGALGGGDVEVSAGQDIIDLQTVSAGSARATTSTGNGGSVLLVFGGGDVSVAAGANMVGGRVDVWSGQGHVSATGDFVSAGQYAVKTFTPANGVGGTVDNLLRLREFDGVISVVAGGDLTLQGIAAMAPHEGLPGLGNNPNWANFYSVNAGLDLLAGGAITVKNQGDNLIEDDIVSRHNLVYPGALRAVAINGDLTLMNGGGGNMPIVLSPSPKGQLSLLAAGDIAGMQIAMLDSDLGILPGYFTNFVMDNQSTVVSGIFYGVPGVTSFTTDSQRAQYHSVNLLDRDNTPIRIAAGGDIGSADLGLSLWAPKQARIDAGDDITNMLFFGQNLVADDITRVVAGRDITATTKIVTPSANNSSDQGAPGPAVQGNLFVLGGQGELMIEAGRDLGPFLNSATLSYKVFVGGSNKQTSIAESEAGGIITIGNDWNPLLPDDGANITAMFGVAHGVNYDALRDTYLDPANLAKLDDSLFVQKPIDQNDGRTSVSGSVADRTQPIYAPVLISWMQSHYADRLMAAYGTTSVDQAQAYAVFAALPPLNQRALLNSVYFNELKQAAIPSAVSYHQYSRGYQAVNTLFPADWGYTRNDLTGGANGAAQTVATGDLDLRLATIQTSRGGDIDIFGPGGRVLAGSTVSTAAQAARRVYDGTRLYLGDAASRGTNEAPRLIAAIPAGYEGVLTLEGGEISTFTDGDFLLNQSRVFTRQGGDIIMWSSNANLNAGQGPKTTSNIPPVVVKINADLFGKDNQAASTTGAGIAGFAPDDGATALPDVYLLAPRGTVDAGDAGVRVAGNLFLGALQVANVANFKVDGQAFGIPTGPTVDVSANLDNSATAAEAVQQATEAMQQSRRNERPSVITVSVVGFGLGSDACDPAVNDACPAH